MIKNCYFKCFTCGENFVRFMESNSLDNYLNKFKCPHCGGDKFEITEGTPKKIKKVLHNQVKDYRGLDKEKYMSQEYKDIRNEINRVHKEKKGLLGERRVFA